MTIRRKRLEENKAGAQDTTFHYFLWGAALGVALNRQAMAMCGIEEEDIAFNEKFLFAKVIYKESVVVFNSLASHL